MKEAVRTRQRKAFRVRMTREDQKSGGTEKPGTKCAGFSRARLAHPDQV